MRFYCGRELQFLQPSRHFHFAMPHAHKVVAVFMREGIAGSGVGRQKRADITWPRRGVFSPRHSCKKKKMKIEDCYSLITHHFANSRLSNCPPPPSSSVARQNHGKTLTEVCLTLSYNLNQLFTNLRLSKLLRQINFIAKLVQLKLSEYPIAQSAWRRLLGISNSQLPIVWRDGLRKSVAKLLPYGIYNMSCG